MMDFIEEFWPVLIFVAVFIALIAVSLSVALGQQSHRKANCAAMGWLQYDGKDNRLCVNPDGFLVLIPENR